MATPPDFTAGQVLTAAQMNAIGSWHISRTTIGSAVSSVTVSDAFSADYDTYRIVINGGTASTSSNLALTLGAAVTGYYQAGRLISYTNTTLDVHDENVASWSRAGVGAPTLSMDVTLFDPYGAYRTGFTTQVAGRRGDGPAGLLGGYLADTTSYTAFTVTTSSGTITGGTIDVYGFRGP